MENQLAQIVIEDGQSVRPFHNYLMETYDEIKGKELSFEGVVFNDRIEYIKHLKGVIETMLLSTQAFKDDNEDEYLLSN